jgi:uncharacterized RDD family membrane protein YckC
MDFRTLHRIDTPENVTLHLELAGMASRVFAALIDLLLMGILMGLISAVLAVPFFLHIDAEFSRTLLPVALFLVFFGYHLLQEWLWSGRTAGKALFNIRVVRNNGQPIGFWEAFGRNLLRVVDVYISGIGLVCMLLNQDEKRLGDFLAGTVVISEQPVKRPRLASAEPSDEQGEILLTPEESDLLRAFCSRRTQLFPESRANLSAAFCQYFSHRLNRPVESEAALDSLLPSSDRV